MNWSGALNDRRRGKRDLAMFADLLRRQVSLLVHQRHDPGCDPRMRLDAALPWVRARREGIAAVSLPGEFVKLELIVDYEDGFSVLDKRNR